MTENPTLKSINISVPSGVTITGQAARSTLDALSAEIAILDDAGNIITVNKAWRAFANANSGDPGVLCEGVNYLAVLQAVDPTSEDYETASAFEAGIYAVMRGEQDEFSLEYPCHSSTEDRWFIGKITRFEDNSALRLVVAHEDITERKLAELATLKANEELATLHKAVNHYNIHLEQTVYERTAQLHRLNDRMSIILNSTSDAIVLVDAQNRIEATNMAFDRLFGYGRDEAFGKPLRILADANSQPDLIKAKLAARENHTSQRIQINAQRKDGRTFDADVALAYVQHNEGHLICSVHDITHLKEVDRAKDAFLSMVSHELKTPVTAIVLSAEMLARYFDRLSDENKQNKITEIREQANVLTELMNSILDTARFDAHKSSQNLEHVDVAKALSDVMRELTPQAEMKRQELASFITEGGTGVSANHVDISRVWRNLLGNAIKYTREQGKIRASLLNSQQLTDENHDLMPHLAAFNTSLPADLKTGNYLIGFVEDNGHGISEQDISQLFTRFFRGWAAGTDIPGTGLGLALVKDILQSYGGDIAVQSEPNIGTTFCFWLPMNPDTGDTGL